MVKSFQADVSDLVIVLGPALRSCCYEVGREFADFFPKAKIYALPEMSSLSEAFLATASKKADVMLAPAFEGMLFAEKNNGVVRPIAGAPVMLMPNVFQCMQVSY